MSQEWNQALDLQLELIDFWHSKLGRSYGHAFAQSVAEAYGSGKYNDGGGNVVDWDKASQVVDDRTGRVHTANLSREQQIDILISDQVNAVARGDTFMVHDEVMDLVEAAAPSWEEEGLLVQDLIVPHGFVVLPRPHIVPDYHGKRLGFRAFSWTTMPTQEQADPGRDALVFESGGIVLSTYSHRDDEDDYPIPPELNRMGHFRLTLCHITPWHFNESHRPLDLQTLDEGPGSGLHFMAQFFQTFQRLAMQTITQSVSMDLPRPQRRDAERREMDTDVKLITLRRAKNPVGDDHVPQPGNYDHRWLVRGHWRNQWYPAEQRHKQIWIHPYEKGPEGTPLVLKPLRVFDFRR